MIEEAKIAKENEFEIARLAGEVVNKFCNIELARLAAEEAKIMKENEIELARLVQTEEFAKLKIDQEKIRNLSWLG